MAKDIDELVDGSIEYLKYIKNYPGYKVLKESVPEAKENFLINPAPRIESGEEININITMVKDKPVERNISYGLIQEEWMNSESIEILDKNICGCKKCPLVKTRTNFVFGTGNPKADVVVVGEAPGRDEDAQGKPFVGRAGQLLTDILKAINFTRDEVFICNILKCRPPENRNPLPEEIFHCEPYLMKQLELINPRLILAVGTFAGQTLLKTKEPLGKLRGKFFDFHIGDIKAKLLVTYHPAALLRNPHWKKPTWEDVKLFRKEYDKK
jgi:uracil-DNA glycosylase